MCSSRQIVEYAISCAKHGYRLTWESCARRKACDGSIRWPKRAESLSHDPIKEAVTLNFKLPRG